MASRKGDGTKELATMLTIIFFLGFFLIKWAIEAIVWIVKAIVILIEKIVHKSEMNKIMKEPLKNTSVKNKADKVDFKEEILKKLHLFDKSIYDDKFPSQIRTRGEVYYNENKIKYFKKTDNKCSCRITGTDEYKVSITFNEENNDIIEDVSCTCPYHQDKQQYCKHIYALLYKIKCEENKDKIKQEFNKYNESIETMIQNADDYIKRNKSNFDNYTINEHNRYSNDSLNKSELFLKQIEESKTEDNCLNYLWKEVQLSEELREKIKKTLKSENSSSTNNNVQVNNDNNKVGVGDVIMGLAIADSIDNHFNKKEDTNSKYTEEELDNWGLADYEKEEVRKGDYEPWDFDEEDMDEDSYYYEDDK